MKIKVGCCENKEKPFPKLMYAAYTNTIIMMISNRCGVVIESNAYRRGAYATNWVMSDFVYFNGKVTLSND